MLIWGRGTEAPSEGEKVPTNHARPLPAWAQHMLRPLIAYVVASYIVATGLVVLWLLGMFGVGKLDGVIFFMWALAPLFVLTPELALPAGFIAVVVWLVLYIRSGDGA